MSDVQLVPNLKHEKETMLTFKGLLSLVIMSTLADGGGTAAAAVSGGARTTTGSGAARCGGPVHWRAITNTCSE